MSRSSSTSANREARREAQRGRVTQPKRRPVWPWIVGAVVVLALIAAFFLTRGSATGDIEGVDTYTVAAGTHSTAPQTYAQTPPVGGVHNPVWQNCGVYSQPVANENGVHSLEHGAVWITYQPNLAADKVAQITQLTRGRAYTLVSPYPGLPSPVVISAWGAQLKLDDPSDPRLLQFITKYMQGPQTPEPGATCSGGISTTVAQ